MEDFVTVAKTSDPSNGKVMLVEVYEERILFSNIEWNFYAIGELCIHVEGPLSDGCVERREVECPLHGIVQSQNRREHRASRR